MWGLVFLAILLPGQLLFAQQNLNHCLELSKQLELMVEAQNQVLNSMVKKNDAVAETLDHFANDLGAEGQRVKKSDLISLRQSAKSFRSHSIRETELVEKFAQRTGILVERIHDCLQQQGNSSGQLPKAKVVQNSRDSNNQNQRQ